MSHSTPLRIARSAGDWVSFQLHREVLERFIPRGSRVLEIDAGVGHYTEALHHLGCKITVLAESLDDLESGQARAHARGFAASVEGWSQRDICSLGDYPDASFDAVVAYGASISHALDRRDRALGECMRVLRPRGVLVLDALSLWGSMRRNLSRVLALDLVQTRAIIRRGDAPRALLDVEPPASERPSHAPPSQVQLSHPHASQALIPHAVTPHAVTPNTEGGAHLQAAPAVHPQSAHAAPAHPQPAPEQPVAEHSVPEAPARERHSHLFRAAELEAFLRRAGLEILSLTASSALSTGVEMPMTSDPGTWSALLEYERSACSERGYLDSGHHLIAVARR